MAIIESIKNFIALFKAKEFDDPYLWIMQQFGHLCLSFIFCYLTGSPYLIIAFWIFWEVRHLALTLNIRDFLEDIFFEMLGAVYFLNLNSGYEKQTLFIILLILVIYCVLRFKLYKKQLT